eukprot:CAMPEP_0182444964 /NCGR_PEP_ID=MMETSP1172-20130603/3249_1 /TAXON_ID=708627 /ORGANISM="Timspurckia oligopyrenoides, Strain CCMP3278" /LENGTH=767 /DNA_ID=CAMNT_0024640643 /DNA_START=28 /DNA_END=2331 /DNA_ORIENTATION=+
MERSAFVSGIGGLRLSQDGIFVRNSQSCALKRSGISSRRSIRSAPWMMCASAEGAAATPEVADSSATATETSSGEEKYEFQAEVSRVMNIIVNSLYSNTEIFLRELVSNASDACDKRRYLALSQGEPANDLFVRVKADKEKQQVVIEDNGVGMTKAEVLKNLGSIATSGTAKFVEALGQQSKGEVAQIGQFGVGFYSAFLVADKISVYTRSMQQGSKLYKWESTSASGYTIAEVEEGLEAPCGTRIVLHIKSGHFEFLENTRLQNLMKRYSEFVDFPIYAWEEKTEMEEVPDGEEKNEDGTPKMKKVPKTVSDWIQVNKQKPIWMRRPREVEDEEYKEFYKTISKEFDSPLAWTHFAAEGDVEFRSVIYTPSTLPFDLRQDMFNNAGRNFKLYVKRVFISEKFEEFVPRWLCFLRGVIDSEDLPLNVSREILQQSRVLRIITKRIIRKAIDMFKEIANRENKQDYIDFWKNFGRYIKAGIIDDNEYARELSTLLRFHSSNSGDELISLASYVNSMKENQKDIYFLVSDSRLAADNSPTLEKLKAKGYQVLYLLEPVDEIAIENLGSFKIKREGKDEEESFKLVNIAKEDFKIDSEDNEGEKKELERLRTDYKDLTDFLTSHLSGKVSKVEVTNRLTESPVAIVQSQFGVSPSMERMMKAQASASGDVFGDMWGNSKVLEVNPLHPTVEELARRLKKDKTDMVVTDMATVLYELALLSAGYTVEDAGSFSKRVARLMALHATPLSDIAADEGKTKEAPKVDAEIVDAE